MQITVAFKKNDGTYEAALICDNKFTRSAVGKSINDLFSKLAGPLLVQPQEDGAEIAINVAILTRREVERMERQTARQRETDEAKAEAEELEKLASARAHEKAAEYALKLGDTPPTKLAPSDGQ